MKKVFRANLFAMILILLQIIGGLMSPLIFNSLNLGLYPRIFLTQILFLIVPTIIYFLITKESVVKTLKLRRLGFKNFFIILAIGFLVQPVVMFLSLITSLFFPNAVGEILSNTPSMSWGLSVLAIGVTPAICEEIVMRGVVLNGYEDVGIKKGAIMTGIIFCILHMNLQQSLYTFAIGMLFAYLVYITKSIFSSMLCHFIINGTQVTIASLALKAASAMPEASSVTIAQSTSTPLLIFMIGFMFLFAAGFGVAVYFLLKLLKKVNQDKIEIKTYHENSYNENYIEDVIKENEKVLNWPMYVSIGVYIVVSALGYLG